MFDAELRELERRFEASSAADDGERYLRALERSGADWPEVVRVRHVVGRTHHERALALLDERPAFSPAAAATLQARERALGLELPDSLREWYSLEGAAECLERHSVESRVVTPDQLGAPGPHVEDAAALRAKSLLVFMVLNRGFLRWAVRVGPGTEPQVVIESRAPWEPQGSGVWSPFARSFAELIGAQLFDQRPRRLGVALEGPAPPPGALATLARALEPWPSTEVGPGEHQYRFGSAAERVAVRCNADRGWWQLSASSERALSVAWRLLEEACGPEYEPLAAGGWDAASEEAWGRIRGEGRRPLQPGAPEGPP